MIGYVHAHVLPAAFACLPPAFDTPAARALLLAIGLQESRFRYRRQLTSRPDYAPARGYWQFELAGGVAGVLTHRATQPHIDRVLEAFAYPPSAHACWTAIEHHDVLACVFARLLLVTLPDRLPGPTDVQRAWLQYLDAWRPGAHDDERRTRAPHPPEWAARYAQAWALVTGGPTPVVLARAA